MAPDAPEHKDSLRNGGETADKVQEGQDAAQALEKGQKDTETGLRHPERGAIRYGPAMGVISYSKMRVASLLHRQWLAWVLDVCCDTGPKARKHGLYGPTPVSRGISIIEKAGEAFRAVSGQFKPVRLHRVLEDEGGYYRGGVHIEGRKDARHANGGRLRLLRTRNTVYLRPKRVN